MRVLFLGLGGVGQRHLRNLKSLVPRAQIAAVRHAGRSFEIGPDLQADHSVDIVQKYAIACYPDIAAAMDFRPDFAVVSTPTSTHVPLTLELVRHGVPVLLEKPVTHDGAGLDELLAEAAQRKVTVAVAYMLRFHPLVRRMRELVSSRVLGRFLSVQVTAHSFMPSWHPYETYNGFYAGRKDLGGGAVMTEIHLVDLLQCMFGQPRRVWCIGGKLSGFDLDVEDTAAALLEYHVDGQVLPVSMNISFVQRPPRFGIVFNGERGRMEWSLADNRLTVEDSQGGLREDIAAPAFERNTMFVDEMRDFIACLREGTTPDSALERVVGGQHVALALKRSLDSGQPVALT